MEIYKTLLIFDLQYIILQMKFVVFQPLTKATFDLIKLLITNFTNITKVSLL